MTIANLFENVMVNFLYLVTFSAVVVKPCVKYSYVAVQILSPVDQRYLPFHRHRCQLCCPFSSKRLWTKPTPCLSYRNKSVACSLQNIHTTISLKFTVFNMQEWQLTEYNCAFLLQEQWTIGLSHLWQLVKFASSSGDNGIIINTSLVPRPSLSSHVAWV